MMDEKEMRKLFRFEQGANVRFHTDPGSDTCGVELQATDTDAVTTGIALLIIRLAETLKVPAENVLAYLAVTIMRIGEQMTREEVL